MAAQGRYFIRQGLLALLLVEVIAGWSIVRTDLFLRETVGNALESTADQLKGRIAFESIHPSGLTGIEIRGLVVHDIFEREMVVRADVVRLFPDLSALLTGDLRIGRVEFVGLTSRARFDLADLIDQVLGRGQDESNSGRASLDGRFSRTVFRRLWAVLPADVRFESVVLTLDNPVYDELLPPLYLQPLRLDLKEERGRPQVRASGHFAFGDRLAGHLEGRWAQGVASRFSVTFDAPLDVIDSLPVSWLGRWPGSVPLPQGASVYVGGFEAGVPFEGLTLRRVDVMNLNAKIPGVQRWRLDGFEADRVRLELQPTGPFLSIESGQVLVAGILEWVSLGLQRGEIRSDWSFDRPSVLLSLGGSDQGSLQIRASRSAYGSDWFVSAIGRDFRVDEFSRLFQSDLPVTGMSGEFTGQVDLSLPDDDEAVLVSIDGCLANGRASVPILSIYPLSEINLGLQAELTYHPRRTELRWDQGRLRMGGQQIEFDGLFEWGDESPSLVFHALADRLGVQELFEGLPRGFAPSLEGFEWSGDLSAFIYLDLDTSRPDQALVDVHLDMSNAGVRRFGPEAPVDLLAGDFEIDIGTGDGAGRTLSTFSEQWVSLDDVAPHLVQALVSAEDGSFWSHSGFDWQAILDSVEQNLREQRFARGGSTISQQVARSLFLGHERTLGRKFEESVLTWQMEHWLDKNRMMELYLNAVHWGPGIYGVREASTVYFRRPPDELTLRESAFLASILPNPDLFGMQYAQAIVPHSRRQKICHILRNMRGNGEITMESYRQNCGEAFRGRISVVPVPAFLTDWIEVEPVAQASRIQRADRLVQVPRGCQGVMRRCE